MIWRDRIDSGEIGVFSRVPEYQGPMEDFKLGESHM